jgi:hypothetical protein
MRGSYTLVMRLPDETMATEKRLDFEIQ